MENIKKKKNYEEGGKGLFVFFTVGWMNEEKTNVNRNNSSIVNMVTRREREREREREKKKRENMQFVSV